MQQNEVEAERLTRIDKMLLSEQQEQRVIDLRPGEGATPLVRENRNLMIGRVEHLVRYDLATELEPGRWIVSDRVEVALKELGQRNEVIKPTHRPLIANGLADERGVGQYALHGEGSGERIVDRFWQRAWPRGTNSANGPIWSAMASMVGSITWSKDQSRIEELARNMFVEAAPVVSGLRPADRNIAFNAAEDDGVYRPGRHRGGSLVPPVAQPERGLRRKGLPDSTS